jgi:hypothetical protein
MVMTKGQVFRCQNRDCGCEIRVLRTSINASAKPRCCCGAEMKKPYRKPVFRSLGSDLERTAAKSNKN